MELSEKLVDKIKGSYGSQLLRKKALDEEVEFLVQTSRRIRREWLEFLKDKKSLKIQEIDSDFRLFESR